MAGSIRAVAVFVLIAVLAASLDGCVNIKDSPNGPGTVLVVIDFAGRTPEDPPEWGALSTPTGGVDAGDTGMGVEWSYNYTFSSGAAVWDALSYLSSAGVSIGTEEYSFGILVVSIAGVVNEGDGGMNWQYWVNGVYGDRAVDMKTLRDGDTILLRFCSFEPRED